MPRKLPPCRTPAFSPRAVRVKTRMPRYVSDGGGRDIYLKDAMCKVTLIPFTSKIYQPCAAKHTVCGTYQYKVPSKPRPSGKGRDAYLCEYPNARSQRLHETALPPWATESKYIYSCDRGIQQT